MTPRASVEHPDFGRAIPCQCQESDDDRQQRVAALERYSNLGALRQSTFANANQKGVGSDSTHRQAFTNAFQAAAGFAENPHGWITFVGPSGCGKTYLAAAIVNRRIETGNAALFITVADFLDYLRGSFDDESDLPFVDLFEQVRQAELLVLDDLPVRPASPWGQERLFQLLAWRYSERLPTVVTLRGDPNRLDDFLRTRLESPDGFGRFCRLGRIGNAGRGIGVIPPSMRRRMSFDSFDLEGGDHLTSNQIASLDAAKSITQSWAENTESLPAKWLNLFGPSGVGKTHLAVAIAAVRENLGDEVFFATVADLLDYLRSTFAPDSPVLYDDLLERIKTADLLVMDDMGAERSTPFAEDKLFQIINYRYEERLPTVITTTQIPDSIGEGRPRIASRLKDRGVVFEVPIEAPDYREGRGDSVAPETHELTQLTSEPKNDHTER